MRECCNQGTSQVCFSGSGQIRSFLHLAESTGVSCLHYSSIASMWYPSAEPYRQHYLAKNANTRIKNMNRGRRLNLNANAHPKAMNQIRKLNPRRLQGPLQSIISVADPANLSLRRWHIDRTLFSIKGSAGSPYTHRCIRHHRQGTLASLKYLQRCPHALRATWSGIALHAGVLPGYPVSRGCIRLASDFAIRLWRLTKRGTRVIIAHHDIHPVQIASPRLFSKAVRRSGQRDERVAWLSEGRTSVERSWLRCRQSRKDRRPRLQACGFAKTD
jgi:L,D-transpeptidase catalytic domain